MKIAPLFLGCALAFGSTPSQAAPLYWDTNDILPGSGGPAPTGSWNTTAANWNTAPSGDGSGSIGAWVNGNAAIFAAGADATASYNVTPNATVTSLTSLTYKDGITNSVLTIDANLEIVNTTGEIIVNGHATSRLALNVILGGTAGLTKTGTGVLQLNSRTATFSGDTLIQEGSLRMLSVNRLPVGTVVTVASGASFDIRGTNTTISGLNGAGSVFRGQSAGASSLTISAASGAHDFSGQLTLPTSTGVLHLFKQGAFTQTLSGTQANLNTGDTTVEGGTLVLAKTSGVNAIAEGTVEVQSSATLRLGAAHQIGNSAILKLSGGTFDLNGVAGEEFSTALALDTSSTIAFGTGASALSFGDSSAETWESALLTITGFELGSDTLRFGEDASGLTADQLALFRFADYSDAIAQIDSLGYVTPFTIPEPNSLALLVGSGLLYRLMRRRKEGAI